MKKIRQITSVIILVLIQQTSWAGISVIGNTNLKLIPKDRELVDLFLGLHTINEENEAFKPINHPEGTEAYNQFYRLLTGKAGAELKSYWSKLIFTGRGYPPQAVLTDEEMKKLITKNVHMIGYIDSKSVDESVKVIKEFK